MKLKENDLVLCTVKRIEGTVVFVEIEEERLEGTIVFSEIAAGRIRNIRDFVFPNKKIVCKVLSIAPNRIDLSLRRVSEKEKTAIIERYKKEKALINLLKIVAENYEEVIKKIKEKNDIVSFFEAAKENPKILEEVMKKEIAEKISRILQEKNEKEKEVKKTIIIKSDSEEGINDIKEVLSFSDPSLKIIYLGSSKFLVSYLAPDYKEAKNKMEEYLEKMKKKAKEKHAFFDVV